jgi:hypothetical protein
MPRGSASTQQRLEIPSPIISAGVCAHCGYGKYLQAVPPTLQARVHAIVVLGIDREAVPVQRAADEPFTLAFGGAKGTDGSSWAMQGTPIAKVGQPHPAKQYVCCDLASLVCGATLALQCNLPCLLGPGSGAVASVQHQGAPAAAVGRCASAEAPCGRGRRGSRHGS